MEHLAWPVALVTIVWWFKDQIKELIRKLKKGKWGSAELEFAELAEAAEIESQAIEIGDNQPELSDFEVAAVVYNDPKSTILTAWQGVEDILTQVVQSHNLPLRDSRNPRTGATIKIKAATGQALRQLSALQRSGLVGPELISLIQDLRALRNEAVHSYDFSPPDTAIQNYLTTAKRVNEVLKKLI
jgi:hypothetical protein